MSEYFGPLYIDGSFREASGGGRFEVTNPADDSVVGEAAQATADDAAAAVSAARTAFDETDWSRDHAFRAHCLTQLQSGLRKEVDNIKTVQTDEAGTVYAIRGVMDALVEQMTHDIDMITAFEWEKNFPAYESLGAKALRRVSYEANGVVAAITPWNAPFPLNMAKTIPALATGNTVVLKPAPETPLTAYLLAKVIDEYTDIPPGVFNLITSSDNAVGGDALTGDRRVDMYHFTGSTATGQRIYERAAAGIRKVVLELGGKSANLILDDADLDVALPFGVAMAVFNSGQGCTLATRMIVHESRYDEVIQRLEMIVPAMPVGNPHEPTNVVGPIIRPSQLERIDALVQRAAQAGARILAGGQRLDMGGKGNWYAPTAVVDVDPDSEIAQTEVFGPVLSVIKYQGDDDAAVRAANNSKYGLSGYVQTSDPDRAWYIARRIRSGVVNIGPSGFYASPETPFGGYKESGIGREGGDEGWKSFLEAKTIAVATT